MLIRKFAVIVHENIAVALAVSLGAGALLGIPMATSLIGTPSPEVSIEALIAAALGALSWAILRFTVFGRPERTSDRQQDLGELVGTPAPLELFTQPPSSMSERRLAIGLPSTEHLLAEIQSDIEGGCRRTLFVMVELSDFERLYSFDPDIANATVIAFARRLRQVLGDKFPASHLGRGCFGIWFRDCEADVARKNLETIAYALRSEIEASGQSLVPDVSLKIGTYPDDGDDVDALMTKTSISSFQPVVGKLSSVSNPQDARQRYSLEQDLRHAVERQELMLQYQPIVDLHSGRIVSAEALIRWRHPSLGQIAPGKFVPLLEEMGLINEIGMWSLNAACAALRTWHDKGFENLSVAINLSAKQLQDPTLVVAIERTLERHQLKSHGLTLELTETAAMVDAGRTLTRFHDLRDLGVHLSIDDFGTGYSSMSYLLKLPFDKLKIDREFVADVHLHPQRQAICNSLFELARGLRIGIVAEGAEAVEEVETLQQIGCHLIQGFYFSRPVPSAQICELASKDYWGATPRSDRTAPLLAGLQA